MNEKIGLFMAEIREMDLHLPSFEWTQDHLEKLVKAKELWRDLTSEEKEQALHYFNMPQDVMDWLNGLTETEVLDMIFGPGE
jgi:hypothetical protein